MDLYKRVTVWASPLLGGIVLLILAVSAQANLEQTDTDITCTGLTVEAEDGLINSDAFQIGSSSIASGGEYIYVPDGYGSNFFGTDDNPHYVTYCFKVETAGTYQLRATVSFDGNRDDQDSFWVEYLDQPTGPFVWHFPAGIGQFEEAPVPGYRRGPIKNGTFMVRVFLREDGAILDKLELKLEEGLLPPDHPNATPTVNPPATRVPTSYPEPSIGCDSMSMEAEDGFIKGDLFQIETGKGASGNQYIQVPEGAYPAPDLTDSDYVTLCFDVPEAGYYKLVGDVSYEGTFETSNEFRLSQPKDTFSSFLSWELQNLDPNGFVENTLRYAGSDFRPFYTFTGPDTLQIVIYPLEDGAQLDKMTLVKLDRKPINPILLSYPPPPDSGSNGCTVPVGALGYGIAATDTVTGSGYIMYSEQPVRSRFPGLNRNNAENFIAVRYSSAEGWQYDNNSTYVSFTPLQGDLLVAEADFSANTITMLAGSSFIVEGVEAGYASGDLLIIAERWNGRSNRGEFGVEGTSFVLNNCDDYDPFPPFPSPVCPADSITVGDLKYGIAAQDQATGIGYIMYSEEPVRSRFSGLNRNNAEQFVVVTYDNNGSWLLDNNLRYVEFTPRSSDRIVAYLNFDTDAVEVLNSGTGDIFGINSGFIAGDFNVIPNQWNGNPNNGEYELSGSEIIVEENCPDPVIPAYPSPTPALPPTQTPVATPTLPPTHTPSPTPDLPIDPAPYQFLPLMLYRGDSPVQPTPTLPPGYPEPTQTPDPYTAPPTPTPTQDPYPGPYPSPTPSQTPEPTIILPTATPDPYPDPTVTPGPNECYVDIGDTGFGVAGNDNATGMGYMMYSPVEVQSRFPGVPRSAAKHLLAVVYDEENETWLADANTSYIPFTPMEGDLLIYEINYDENWAEILTPPAGTSIEGFPVWNLSLTDIGFIMNQWNGNPNNGEFGVTGSFFELVCDPTPTPPAPTPTTTPAASCSIDIGALNRGVPGFDNRNTISYLMYSSENVRDRFDGLGVSTRSEKFIIVNYELGPDLWFYDANTGYDIFTPRADDRLIATLDWTNNTVEMHAGEDRLLGGINLGYISSDLSIMLNTWNGAPNNGELYLEGSSLVVPCP